MTLWRTALTVPDHPLHRAAWLLFAKGISPETANKYLADQRDAVKPLIQEIIDDDDLFDAKSPGDGHAPVRAIHLAGVWNMTEIVPSLLEMLEFSEDQEALNDAIYTTLVEFGEAIVDEVLAWGTANPDMSLAVADLLGEMVIDNEAAFNWILQWVEKVDDDLETYLHSLIEVDPVRAETWLKDQANNARWDKQVQKTFRSFAKEARKEAKKFLEWKLKQPQHDQATSAELVEEETNQPIESAETGDETET
jgi:hypothetical protein